MESWLTIGSTIIPSSETELTLSRRNDDFAILISGLPGDLMNSRMHHSEDALAEFGCDHLRSNQSARVLVGGLGMGFTLAAALKIVGESAEVVVAELVPAVVEWNRGPLGQCAGRPLADSRSRVHVGDVAELIKMPADPFDAILLDIDNGPEAITHCNNQWLYSQAGLHSIHEKLRPGGFVTIWSARADHHFGKRLEKADFRVRLRTVRARPGKGSRHTIFVARKPGAQSKR